MSNKQSSDELFIVLIKILILLTIAAITMTFKIIQVAAKRVSWVVANR